MRSQPPELKSCPFCGWWAAQCDNKYETDGPIEYWIGCHNCEARGEWFNSLEDAIKAWNTRHEVKRV